MNENNDNVFKTKATGPIFAAVLLVLVIAVIIVVVFIIASSADSGDSGENNGEAITTTTTTTTTTKNDGADGPDTPDDPGNSDTPDNPDTPDDPDGPDTPDDPDGPDNPGGDTPTVQISTISVNTNDAYKGSLLLIDERNNYKVSSDLLISRTQMSSLSKNQLRNTYNFANVYGTTDGNYKVKSVTGYYLNVDALDAFNKMMAAFAAEQGKTDVQLRNAYYYDPSEDICLNATGYMVDLEINTENGKYPLKYTPFMDVYYNWFIQNCAKYGFIHVADVKNSAGEENYSSFRYVGVAHATYMTDSEMKLDEYLTFIKGYLFDNRLVMTDADGNEWWVYYVAGTGEETPIRVIGENYEISGNNYDGFVVAINASALVA